MESYAGDIEEIQAHSLHKRNIHSDRTCPGPLPGLLLGRYYSVYRNYPAILLASASSSVSDGETNLFDRDALLQCLVLYFDFDVYRPHFDLDGTYAKTAPS